MSHLRSAITIVVVLCVVSSSLVTGTALASDPGKQQLPPEDGPLFGIGEPETMWVEAPDGADIYVELYRPVRSDRGFEPPNTYPTILRMSPYEGSQPARLAEAQRSSPLSWRVRDRYVPQGYAFALGHVYGTGNSDGCLELFGDDEIAATSATIEALASEPWSDGKVGMFGTSYDGGEALHVAARGSEAAREHLRAVVAWDGTTSMYETFGHDGVPGTSSATQMVASYVAIGQPPAVLSPPAERETDAERLLGRQAGACRAENIAAAAEFERTADFTPWLEERSARSGAESVTAATLMFEGFHDGQGVGTFGAIGYFDRIPKQTPHKLVLGQWAHAQPAFYLADLWTMVDEWFDHHVRGTHSRTDAWPNVQIQDSAGSWRAEDSWPDLGGEYGQLALASGGGLGGTTTPTGSTSYLEGAPFTVAGVATFTTGPLRGPLHIAGDPVLDLWVELEGTDGHITTQLHAYTADGTPITGTGQVDNLVGTGRVQVVGSRSVQHLDPIHDGEFRQATAKVAPRGVPVHVPVRFVLPVDLVVPAGGWITVEVSGSNFQGLGPTTPSGKAGHVKILHNCVHPSVLRFDMPDMKKVEWLDVPMTDRALPQIQPVEVPEGPRDGGGLAVQEICEEKPVSPTVVIEGPWV